MSGGGGGRPFSYGQQLHHRAGGAFARQLSERQAHGRRPGHDPGQGQGPLGEVSTYVYGTDAGVIKDSAGNYHIDVEPAAQGVWKYRWEGLNSNKAAKENSFAVEESSFD